ncbi:GIY-YIG nuclease family protein [Shewanella sp.]|uniref:GIY-YIG nuclease family protein n=1 Tax=Shewanella sp. TaxID=50422 RepID=UPI002603D187|nr:GIY-YIG nuclease family protein [Shewanella sp.]
MTDLVVETANPHHLASPKQGASQAQTSNKPEAVAVEQALDSEQAVTSDQAFPLDQAVTAEIVQASVWYLYLIRCANGHLYTGITTDVTRRFNEHQSNGPKAAKYLRGKGPLTLMYQEQVGTRSDALKREIAVKKLSRAQKLALIESAEQR